MAKYLSSLGIASRGLSLNLLVVWKGFPLRQTEMNEGGVANLCQVRPCPFFFYQIFINCDNKLAHPENCSEPN